MRQRFFEAFVIGGAAVGGMALIAAAAVHISAPIAVAVPVPVSVPVAVVAPPVVAAAHAPRALVTRPSRPSRPELPPHRRTVARAPLPIGRPQRVALYVPVARPVSTRPQRRARPLPVRLVAALPVRPAPVARQHTERRPLPSWAHAVKHAVAPLTAPEPPIGYDPQPAVASVDVPAPQASAAAEDLPAITGAAPSSRR